MKEVVVIDYGMGNLKSVQRGLEKVGATVNLSSDPDIIANAGRLVLPGVGAFEDGMKGLEIKGHIGAIHEFVQKGNPFLGICLGMQMLLDESEEYGLHRGLGIIPGSVKAIPVSESGKFLRKIPHIGWNALKLNVSRADWNNTCLQDIEDGDFFYFVHSFMAVPNNSDHLVAQCIYEKLLVTAAITMDNVTGVQFHPEKSGLSGLKLLKRFVS
ncbi:MAG: imidazole glycerol phosphate synthase subunit HisH [Desulfamplus sp.]|nr:imidazole glycerol phosphate synthase subunit HisH [Desulfamplus sp.]